MSDNLLQTLQQLVQDVIAPDVRELKVRMGSLEKQIDALEKHLDNRFTSMDQKNEAQFKAVDAQFRAMDQKNEAQFRAMDQKNDAQFKTILAAISESKAQTELTNVRFLATLSERIAVLESQQRH